MPRISPPIGLHYLVHFSPIPGVRQAHGFDRRTARQEERNIGNLAQKSSASPKTPTALSTCSIDRLPFLPRRFLFPFYPLEPSLNNLALWKLLILFFCFYSALPSSLWGSFLVALHLSSYLWYVLFSLSRIRCIINSSLRLCPAQHSRQARSPNENKNPQ